MVARLLATRPREVSDAEMTAMLARATRSSDATSAPRTTRRWEACACGGFKPEGAEHHYWTNRDGRHIDCLGREVRVEGGRIVEVLQ